MKVFLLKDIEKVGLSGEIIRVSDGFAVNYLFPRKLAVQVTPENEASFAKKVHVVEERKAAVESKTSMLAERIKALTVVLKKKGHDTDRLFGSVGASDIVDLLAEKGISVAKNQILIDKPIKKAGVHQVVVKLSSRLQPTLTLKIVAEAE